MKSLELADLEPCQLVPALLPQFLQFGRYALELSSFLVLGSRLDELSICGGAHACESAFFCIDAFALSFGLLLLLLSCGLCESLVLGWKLGLLYLRRAAGSGLLVLGDV